MNARHQDEMEAVVSAFLRDAAQTKRGWLLRVSSPLLPLAHDAEDAVQQSLLKAYEKRATFIQDGDGDDGGKMAAWLQRIVRNTAVDMARRNQRRNRSEYALDVDEMQDFLDLQIVSREPGPEWLLE